MSRRGNTGNTIAIPPPPPKQKQKLKLIPLPIPLDSLMPLPNVSIAPKSEYVKLYKEKLKFLVKEKVKEKPILSIEDCEFIRNQLPSAHTKVYKEADDFYYDHLFVKYFLNNKNYKYDPAYVAYGTDMFLYSQLYKSIKRKQIQIQPTLPDLATSSHSSSSLFEKDYQTTKDLLRDSIMETFFTTGDLSLSKIMMKLCEDIKAVLYLNITPLTIENYDRVCKNMKVLQYVYHIYKLTSYNNIEIVPPSKDKNITYIYTNIIGIYGKYLTSFDDLLTIYKNIELLYRYSDNYIYNYIYKNSGSCKNDACSISFTEFTDNYEYDNGDVSIIPYFEKKLKYGINDYSCFSTEGIYGYIEHIRGEKIILESIKIVNPRTGNFLTLYDIIYVYENMIKLLERNKTIDYKTKLTHLKDIIEKLKETNNIYTLTSRIKVRLSQLKTLLLVEYKWKPNVINIIIIIIESLIESLIEYNIYKDIINNKNTFNVCKTLIEQELKLELDILEEISYMYNIIESFIQRNYDKTEFKKSFKKFFELSRGNEDKGGKLGYLYLTINLGDKHKPFRFNVITYKDALGIDIDIRDKKYSRAITYPIFEKESFNKQVSQIIEEVYDPKMVH